MPDPIVYIDRSEIRDGRLEEVRMAVKELAEFVEANEPQLISYTVHVDEDGGHMNVVHVHRDSASMAFHMNVAGPLFAPFGPLIRLLSIDVYGQPGHEVIEQLQHKARILGGATVGVHPSSPVSCSFRKAFGPSPCASGRGHFRQRCQTRVVGRVRDPGPVPPRFAVVLFRVRYAFPCPERCRICR